VLIVWGDADIAFRAKERARFEAHFPRHRTHVLRGAGHFIWDDAPKEALKVFEDWWPTTLPSIGKSLGSAVAEDAPT
jgi:haloalkane dehalogenase